MKKPFNQRYAEHLRSTYWSELKRKVVKRRGHKCERCNVAELQLDLHHEHYKTFGLERQKDVRLLCRKCHAVEDTKRAARGRISRAMYRVDFGTECDKDVELLSATAWRGSN